MTGSAIRVSSPHQGSGRERRARRFDPAGSPADGVLLTGATGFLGMALLARFLEGSDRRVYALVRAKDDREAAARVQRALVCLFGAGHPYTPRVVPMRGDLTCPDLDLSPSDREQLGARVSEIVHGAATVSFECDLRTCRAVNVEGTRRMLELAESCRARGSLRRFTYISTAYVAGRHVGCFSEDDLDVGQRFRNPYEQSKFEAECLVGRVRPRLPVTVVRPSIVVGERASGWTNSFNVLYWPLRAFSRGVYVAIPARGSAPVDVVPVDYVVDAILALANTPAAVGATFHLTAGRCTSDVAELVGLASEFFGRPAPRLIKPALYQRVLHPLLLRTVQDERHRRALKRSEVFFPYFDAKVRYDDRRARAALHASGVEPTPLRDYFDRLVEFALAADWGRRAMPRSGRELRLWSVRQASVHRRTMREAALAG